MLRRISLIKPQVYHYEAARIREVVNQDDFSLSLTKHARQEMRNDDLDIVDIIHVLQGCSVINVEGIGDDARYTVEGRTVDASLVNVVIKLMEMEGGILVITVFEVQ